MFIKRFFLIALAFSPFSSLYAQLCQGSLGDPVVNISFGSGNNPGPALGLSITNYNYFASSCPNDGYYTLASSTDTCFRSTWHSLSTDHTEGDNNGYMMLVNASYTAGDFFVAEINGLCGGTTYEFAAWMINVLKPGSCFSSGIQPNINFSIETISGQVLQSYSTGNINSSSLPTWKQYGLYFKTPAGTTSVKLRITNNARGGCGNDLALDDITFKPCGPLVYINVNGVSSVKETCADDTAGLNFNSAIVGGFANTFYQWQKSSDSILWTDIAGANTNSYSTPAINKPGKYFFRLSVAEGNSSGISSCRIASQAVLVNVNSLPIPAAATNSPVCEGANLTLNTSGGNNNVWTGPANFSSNLKSPVIANASMLNNGIYYVKAVSLAGCTNTDSVRVRVNTNPLADAGNDTIICEGASAKLQGTVSNATTYIWSPALGLSDLYNLSPLASPVKTTSYTLTAHNGICKDSASVLINVIKKPGASAGPDKAIIGTQNVTLQGQATGSNIRYYWTPNRYISSDTILTPIVFPPYDTSYTLHVISNDGCGEDIDKVLVKYYKEIYIPNAFTPNNDGLNDYWNIPALNAFPLAEVSVYNRYGELIFYNKGYTKQWDGSFKGMRQPTGVYVYMIDLKIGLRKLNGTITIIH